MTAALTADALLAALAEAAGAPVEGMRARPASAEAQPATGALAPTRQAALLAAWAGTQLHAAEPGLLTTDDADLALLVGDWCLAYALQRLAQEADQVAIGVLADAIAACATALHAPGSSKVRAAVWADAAGLLADVS